MILLSFQSGTLWFSPYVDFPLFAIPSVFIGDTIFLPWFNCKLYRLLVQTRSFVINSLFFLKIAILVGISYFINSYTHLVWVSDQYLGFMDMQPGKLSPAGIWHLWFSIFQFALIVLAVWVSIDFYNKKDFQALSSIGKIWQIIVWFSALIIPDFLIRHLFIFKDANNPQQLIKDFGSFSTLIISIIVLLIIRYSTSRLIPRSGTQS